MEKGPFLQKDDVEHYRKSVDTPLGRTAMGVAAAATVGVDDDDWCGCFDVDDAAVAAA